MNKNHFEKFFLFDFVFFGLIAILYHYSGINDNFLKNLSQTLEFPKSLDTSIFSTMKFQCWDQILAQPLFIRILGLYGISFILGRIFPSNFLMRLLIILSCTLVTMMIFEPWIILSPYFILLLGANLLLFLHWHQTYQSSSLRLCYLCLGIIALDQGMMSLGWNFTLFILYLAATKTFKKRLKSLLDPIGMVLFASVLMIWHQDIRSYTNPYLSPFFPALGLLLSFKIDRIWHHRWIQKYRQWISSGLALSLPTGALFTLHHGQGLPEILQPFSHHLSELPCWIWLSLSTFGVFRCFRFRRSFWPEVTTAFQMIPLMWGGVQVMQDTHHLSLLQPFIQNVLNQTATYEHVKMPLINTRMPRHLRKGMSVLYQRNDEEFIQ